MKRINFLKILILLVLLMLPAGSIAAQTIGTVTTSEGSTLNLRKGPGTEYTSLKSLKDGTEVEILCYETDSSGSKWYKSAYSGTTGYLIARYVTVSETGQAQNPTEYPAYLKVTASVSLRKTMSTSGTKLAGLSAGTAVKAISRKTNSAGKVWYEIYLADGTHGYALASCFERITSASEIPEALTELEIAGRYGVTTGTVVLRKGPGSSYSSLTKLSKNTVVEVLGEITPSKTVWYHVRSGDLEGYLSGLYLNADENAVMDMMEAFLTYPTAGKTTAAVKLRCGSGTGYEIVKRLTKDTMLQLVTERKAADGTLWYEAYLADGTHGFVKGSYVKTGVSGSAKLMSAGKGNRTGTVTAEDLNVRLGPGTEYETLGELAKGSNAVILGEATASTGKLWYLVEYGDMTGFASSTYLIEDIVDIDADAASKYPMLGQTTNKGVLRSGAGTDQTKICDVAKGTYLKLVAQKRVANGRIWYEAFLADGTHGWISSCYMKAGLDLSLAPKGLMSVLAYPCAGQITYSTVTIRAGRGSSYRALGTLQKGDVIRLVSGKENSSGVLWYKIRCMDGTTGYVTSKAVRTDVADSDIPVTLLEETHMGTVLSKVTVRKGTSTEEEKVGTVKRLDRVQILSRTTVNEILWYKIKTDSMTGYVKAKYVSADSEYELDLIEEGFPKSYRQELIELHTKYPNWIFHADQVNNTFEYCVSQQYAFKKGYLLPSSWSGTEAISLIDLNSLASWKSDDPNAYDYATGRWITGWDGSSWAIASQAIIEYSLDPRNFLNKQDIFQFMNLQYDDSQTVSVVQQAAAAIGSNWLNKRAFEHMNGDVVDYPQLLLDAGKENNVNPVFLTVMVAQEIGLTGSERNIIRGTMSGYEGLYNYFNIGAFADPDEGFDYAWQRGLWVAGIQSSKWGRPWNTRAKALSGGANYYSTGYINSTTRNQDNFYYIRFDVMSESTRDHQFSTDVREAYSIGWLLSKAYTEEMRTVVDLTFDIPVYRDMPAEACAKPTSNAAPTAK